MLDCLLIKSWSKIFETVNAWEKLKTTSKSHATQGSMILSKKATSEMKETETRKTKNNFKVACNTRFYDSDQKSIPPNFQCDFGNERNRDQKKDCSHCKKFHSSEISLVLCSDMCHLNRLLWKINYPLRRRITTGPTRICMLQQVILQSKYCF